MSDLIKGPTIIQNNIKQRIKFKDCSSNKSVAVVVVVLMVVVIK